MSATAPESTEPVLSGSRAVQVRGRPAHRDPRPAQIDDYERIDIPCCHPKCGGMRPAWRPIADRPVFDATQVTGPDGRLRPPPPVAEPPELGRHHLLAGAERTPCRRCQLETYLRKMVRGLTRPAVAATVPSDSVAFTPAAIHGAGREALDAAVAAHLADAPIHPAAERLGHRSRITDVTLGGVAVRIWTEPGRTPDEPDRTIVHTLGPMDQIRIL